MCVLERKRERRGPLVKLHQKGEEAAAAVAYTENASGFIRGQGVKLQGEERERETFKFGCKKPFFRGKKNLNLFFSLSNYPLCQFLNFV